MQQSKAPKYRQDEGLRSEIEWDSDLRALLIEDPPIGDVTAVARTDGSGYMFLDIRNKVCGDTVRHSLNQFYPAYSPSSRGNKIRLFLLEKY